MKFALFFFAAAAALGFAYLPRLAQTAEGQQIPIPQELAEFFNNLNIPLYAAPPAATSSITISVTPDPPQTGELAIAEALGAVNPASTNYTWYINGIKRSDLSGLGDSVAPFVVPAEPGPTKIKVEAVFAGGATTSVEKTVIAELSATSKALAELQTEADRLSEQMQAAEESFSIGLSVTPENPRPGETVTAEVGSFQVDVRISDIAWFFNDKKIAAGRGVKTVQVTLGPAGSRNELRVTVTTADGRRAEESTDFNPVTISFYWWTNAYVPAWYRSKALPSPGSTVFLQARTSLPAGVAQSLLYTWFIGDNPVVSGVGQSTFAFAIPSNPAFFDPIKLRITNIAKTISQEEEFRIEPVKEEILAYEVRPLAGIDTSRAIEALTKPAGTALDVAIEPFFTPRTALSRLQYRWNLNGKEIPGENTKNPRVFTLTSTPDAKGLQSLSVSLVDPAAQAERGTHAIRINLE